MAPNVRNRSVRRRALEILLLAVAYFAAGKLGLGLTVAFGNATPVWAPTGISLAALLLFGRQLWPGVALGAFLVNATTHTPLLFSASAAAGNTGAVLVAVWLIERGGGVGLLGRFRQVLLLVGVALVSPIVSATVGAGALALTDALPWRDVPFAWWIWWLGDSLGFIIITPLLLAWARLRQLWPIRRRAEAAALAMALAAVVAAAFGPWSVGILGSYPLAYAVVPIMAWAALRFGQPGATLANLLTSGVALWAIVRDYEYLSHGEQAQVLLLWQVFSAVVAITSLVIASTAAERNRAVQELERHTAELEQRVAERTAELRKQNDQMVEFSYSISHDLRAPIRAISGYVQALSEDVSGQLDATGEQYIARIEDATRRMDALIQNLLAYSRLSKVELAHEEVNVAEAVEEALSEVRSEFGQRDVLLLVEVPGDLPPVRVHRLTLVQTIANLLLNAAKFMPPDRVPEVRMRAEERSDRVRLWIADNGIGIRPEHHARIFRVFERLHSTELYPGTGVGLAMAWRAMERMGGAIGVESELGSGSRFWLEMPIGNSTGDKAAHQPRGMP